MSAGLLLKLNKLFPLPKHPFNMQNDGEKTYAMWQYERGADTVKFYTRHATLEEMFCGKTVLDVGCGAGGKTMFYAQQGASHVYGIDVVKSYEKESEKLASELGVTNFTFVPGDAAHTSFADNTFDTIIMNDAMEHVDDPEGVLREVHRILKPGGRLYVNFPPYYHPYGAHLSDAIGMPWVHMFFSEKSMILAYKSLVKDLPDGEDRIKFRINRRADGTEYFSYINKMTLKRFKNILKTCPLRPAFYDEVPLRGFLTPFCKAPGLREIFVKMAVCILEK